jgi:hypothetical protein
MKSKKNSTLFLLIIVCLLYVLFLIWKVSNHQERIAQSNQNKTNDVSSKVNTHLQLTSKKIEQQIKLREFQKDKLPSVGDSLIDLNNAELNKLEFTSDTNERRVLDDLNNVKKDYRAYNSPSSQILNDLKVNEEVALDNKQQVDSYVKQFKENARKAGYIIEVDENYIVRSVKKAPLPNTKATPFDLGVGGSK